MSKESFYRRNQPKYQEIEIVSFFMDKAATNDLQEFLQQTTSVSKSGSAPDGQGCDFLLKEENREVHQWIRRCIATDESLQQVIRTKDGLAGIMNPLQNSLV